MKNNMKWYIVLFTLIETGLMLFAMAGCSSDSDTESEAASAAGTGESEISGGIGGISGFGGAGGTIATGGTGGAQVQGGSGGTPGTSGAGAGGTITTGGAGGMAGAGGSLVQGGTPGTAGTAAGGTIATGDAGGSSGTGGATSDAGTSSAARPLSAGLSFEITVETPGDPPYFNIYRPADLDAAVAETGGPLPVIVWANGACMRRDDMWVVLYNRWASGGYVTLALDTVPVGAIGSSSVTADDQIALVDWLFAEVGKAGSPYAGKLDTTRVIASGNSCGGVTSLNAASRDERMTALFILSGSSALGTSDPNIMRGITVPVFWIEGGVEDISRAAATADYENLADDVPGLIVIRSSGDHLAISNDLTNLGMSAEMALHWLDLALYGSPEAYDVLTSGGPLCSGCDASLWTVFQSQNLEKLLK